MRQQWKNQSGPNRGPNWFIYSRKRQIQLKTFRFLTIYKYIIGNDQKFLSGGDICQIYFLSGITGFFSPHLELFKCHLIKMFSPVVLSEQPLAHHPRSNHAFLSQGLQHSWNHQHYFIWHRAGPQYVFVKWINEWMLISAISNTPRDLKKKINFLKENFLLIFTVNFLYIFHLALINLILLLALFYFFLCLTSLFQTL